MHIACQAGCYYFIFHLSYPKCPLGVGTRELLFGIVKADIYVLDACKHLFAVDGVLQLQLHIGLTARKPYLAYHNVAYGKAFAAVCEGKLIGTAVGVYGGEGYLPAVVNAESVGGVAAEGGGYFSAAVIVTPYDDRLSHLDDHMVGENCCCGKCSHNIMTPFGKINKKILLSFIVHHLSYKINSI